ncbi:5'-3' DNA helicase ZGRF1 isoform X12 [Rattus norvegicus]|uniref:5'-3' DNA helicase ZGRF1 isoform X12 n=1 Tax=Rattus norvegicus TaxID=10116 RepID=UPI0019170DBC|nr:protein ZGRF1 isoform X13 [Rattus norvegicus]
MECQEFIVLYTHQKMKKSKVWQDGVLKTTQLGSKAILYDDKGTCLESLFLKCLEVKPGDDLETDRYLITVEEAKAAGSRAVEPDGPREALESGPRTLVSSSRSLGCQPSGLKRKATGFQRPYKMPKKVAVTENSGPAASLGDGNSGLPGPRFLPTFSNTLPLFSTVGHKDVTTTSADNESPVTFRNTERSDMSLSSLSSSFTINTDTLGKEDKLCFPVSSETKYSDSLLASEPMRRNGLDSFCPGVSQTIRSKAQILALLKSSSTTRKDLPDESTGHVPKIQPHGCLKITSKPKEDCAETQSTGNLHCEQQSENPTRSTSRWASQEITCHSSVTCPARLSSRASGISAGLKNIGFQDNKNFQRFPFLSGASVPFVTLPPDDGPAVLDSCSFMIDDDTREPSGSSRLNLCEESGLSFDLGLEDQDGIPRDVLLLPKSSTQSKWLKYQNPSHCNSAALNRIASEVTEDLSAEAVSGLHFSHTSESESSVDPVHLQMIKGMLYQQQQDFTSQDLVSRQKALSLNLNQTSRTGELRTALGSSASSNCRVRDGQEINNSDLCFPNGQKILSAYLPQRQVHIPAVFQSPAHYRQIFTSSIIEHLNILLFGLAQRLYKALSKVDISFYTSSKGEMMKSGKNNSPSCHHNQPAKLVMVKKEGPNKGRLFYTCDKPKGNQCKFFKWLEDVTPEQLSQNESQPNMIFNDIKSIGSYLRSQKIAVYEECQLLLRKGFDFQKKQHGKLKKLATVNPEFYSETKSKLYLKLSRKESSSVYSKGDLWVISKTLDFELDTFIACSAFFGPSSVNEVELLPLKGYFPSNWPTNITVHALLVCNVSTELTMLQNIQDYFNPATLPLMPYLLAMSQSATVSSKNVSKRKFIPPAITSIKTKFELLHLGATLQLARELINVHRLNNDQASALMQIAQMMASRGSDEDALEPFSHSLPITVIHGVFGAGKSYLLAVVILFLVELFEKCDSEAVGRARPWKLLISSSTNVAVDRVLLGLLSLGFEKFIRVGSVRKIAKPVLPYSLHASSDNESEQLKELHALMREELTPIERVYVRKSIEQHKLGTNRVLLKQARVVGITCAACPFPCMNDLKFPVVVLDECSQMTEPASLLPIARFECEKLILVGDPKQLPPTIQGSDAAHGNGLEQTLFDRLCLMGHKPIQLRTQYRCHPVISAIANDLFYEGNLVNGISERERSPVLEWLPTLCFYNVTGTEQVERENSFVNVAEAAFTLKLIRSLIASGLEGSMIGVITLYKSQMYKICSLLSAVDVDHPDVKAVEVSTVDAFQGAEKEIIILSCVRTRQVGFIDSEKRMNVALTRGRRHLLIIGSLSCLRKNQLWGRVIQHCKGREDGLQHASQCEPQLDRLLKEYLEKQAEEKQKKTEKEKLKDKSH